MKTKSKNYIKLLELLQKVLKEELLLNIFDPSFYYNTRYIDSYYDGIDGIILFRSGPNDYDYKYKILLKPKYIKSIKFSENKATVEFNGKLMYDECHIRYGCTNYRFMEDDFTMPLEFYTFKEYTIL